MNLHDLKRPVEGSTNAPKRVVEAPVPALARLLPKGHKGQKSPQQQQEETALKAARCLARRLPKRAVSPIFLLRNTTPSIEALNCFRDGTCRGNLNCSRKSA